MESLRIGFGWRSVGGVLAALASALVLLGLAALMAIAVIKHLDTSSAPPETPTVHLVSGTRDTLELSPEVIQALDILTAPVEQAGSRDRLELLGSLFVDPNHMVRIHSRFAGEVVSIGSWDSVAANRANPPQPRPLRVGDHVSKGQLLLVVWSKDIGEKKSDLVDALSELARDEVQLQKLQSLDPGVVPLKDVREAQRRREADVINVERAERTLRSWRLTQEEIDVARVEAEKIHNGQPRDPAAEQHWAEVEVRAPFDGIILERNVTLGDLITTDLDLFKIADLSTLGVLVHAYEENLPDLEALPPESRQWTVRLKSLPRDRGVPGAFEAIGNVIDPTQHAATVMGWVDNRTGSLRVGQFVTASIPLPARADEVVIPKSALIEQGTQAMVFVAQNSAAHRVERRAVSVARRASDRVFVHSQPTSRDAATGCKPLQVGEYVVVSGTVELAGALQAAVSALPSPESLAR